MDTVHHHADNRSDMVDRFIGRNVCVVDRFLTMSGWIYESSLNDYTWIWISPENDKNIMAKTYLSDEGVELIFKCYIHERIY